MKAPLLLRLRGVLAKPLFGWCAIAVATALVLPSLSAGLFSDDYVLVSQLRLQKTIAGLARGPWDLMVFFPRSAQAARALIDEGVFSWWTDPTAKFALFRPLASLTHALDTLVWPASPRAWHLHSVLWFVVALVAVRLLYRSVIANRATAGVALLLFALDDAHGPAVGWLASRNTIMAFAFAVLALWAHAECTRGRFRAGVVLGPLALALGLLSGEIALGAVAYLVSYALVVDRGMLRQRLARLTGFGIVVIAWAAVYVALGYGTSGTGNYLDPLHDPGTFLRALAFRAPILLVAQLFMPWSDLWPVYPYVHPALPYLAWTFALVALGCMALVATPRVRRDPVARFFAFGMVLSVLPVCAVLPTDRVLWFVGLGGMGLAASVVEGFLLDVGLPRRRRNRRLAGAAVALMALVHVAVNFYWLPARALSNRVFAPALERAEASVDKSDEVRRKSVILVNPPFEPMAWYLTFMRDARGEPRPGRLRVLATGASGVAFTRVDERTLRVRPSEGFLSNAADRAFRSPRRPIAEGQAFDLPDVAIEVTETRPDGRPAEAIFRFRAPLEDPSFKWLRWGDRGFVPFDLPRMGETVTLGPVDFARMLAPAG